MGALNPNALSKFVGMLYVAPIGTVDTTDDAEIKAMTGWTRLASVRGLKSETTIEPKNIKADDTGTIESSVKPAVQFLCTFLENCDAKIMDLILPGTRTRTAGVSDKFVISKVAQSMPRLAVKIHAPDPADATKARVLCLSDAVLNGTYSQEFIDIAESGDIAGSNIVFDLQDGGQFISFDEIFIAEE